MAKMKAKELIDKNGNVVEIVDETARNKLNSIPNQAVVEGNTLKIQRQTTDDVNDLFSAELPSGGSVIVEDTFSSTSVNAQSGKAVAEAISTKAEQEYVDEKIGELSEKIATGGGSIPVDASYSPTSSNAQSGKAVAEAVKDTMEDVVYIQNPNLYDGEWAVGRWNYNNGAVYAPASTHCRNVNPIILDSNKSYNIMPKRGVEGNIYILKYDSEGHFLEYEFAPCDTVTHLEGIGAVNFSITDYSTRYPDTPLYVMVWEDNDANHGYEEYLNYGEKSKYYRTKLVLNEDNASSAFLRMNKSKFDDSFNYIAYSKVTESQGPINTAEHFEWCAKSGKFTALKGDIQLTSDNAIIMCHDVGITLNGEGRVKSYDSTKATMVHDMTEDECLSLEHQLAYNGNYCKMCNIDTYLFICKKYGMIPYITIRDQYIDIIVPILLEKLDKYNLRERAIINSFTYTTLQAIRRVDPDITLSQVRYSNNKITKTTIDNAAELGNCQVCGFDFPDSDGTTGFANITEEIMDYAREKDIRIYEAQVNANEIDTLIQMGIAGAHIITMET